MKFEEVLPYYKKGYAIRRKSWELEYNIRLIDNKPYYVSIAKYYRSSSMLLLFDILSDDWELEVIAERYTLSLDS